MYQELLEGYVQLFAAVLMPYSALPLETLKQHCIGLIGAGEAFSSAMVRGNCSEAEAAQAFAALIQGGLH